MIGLPPPLLQPVSGAAKPLGRTEAHVVGGGPDRRAGECVADRVNERRPTPGPQRIVTTQYSATSAGLFQSPVP